MSTSESTRYWTHDEISDEAARLSRAENLIGRAVEDLGALPSLSGDLVGDHADTRAVVEALQDALVRLSGFADCAAGAAADSYVNECERHASTL